MNLPWRTVHFKCCLTFCHLACLPLSLCLSFFTPVSFVIAYLVISHYLLYLLPYSSLTFSWLLNHFDHPALLFLKAPVCLHLKMQDGWTQQIHLSSHPCLYSSSLLSKSVPALLPPWGVWKMSPIYYLFSTLCPAFPCCHTHTDTHTHIWIYSELSQSLILLPWVYFGEGSSSSAASCI